MRFTLPCIYLWVVIDSNEMENILEIFFHMFRTLPFLMGFPIITICSSSLPLPLLLCVLLSSIETQHPCNKNRSWVFLFVFGNPNHWGHIFEDYFYKVTWLLQVIFWATELFFFFFKITAVESRILGFKGGITGGKCVCLAAVILTL